MKILFTGGEPIPLTSGEDPSTRRRGLRMSSASRSPPIEAGHLARGSEKHPTAGSRRDSSSDPSMETPWCCGRRTAGSLVYIRWPENFSIIGSETSVVGNSSSSAKDTSGGCIFLPSAFSTTLFGSLVACNSIRKRYLPEAKPDGLGMPSILVAEARLKPFCGKVISSLRWSLHWSVDSTRGVRSKSNPASGSCRRRWGVSATAC